MWRQWSSTPGDAGRGPLVAALLVLVSLTGCGGDGAGPSTATAPTASTPTATTPTTTTPVPTTPTPPAATTDIVVYFLRGEKLAPAHRSVARTGAIASGAVRQLLAGPTTAEASSGLTSTIPAGTSLRGVSIAGGVATIDLSGAYDDGGGKLSMSGRLAQVVYTLAQFPTIEDVRFKLDGRPVTVFSGEGLILDGPQTRQTYDELAPPILVERPAPDQAVAGSLRLAGNADVFEATVSYELRDSTGGVVREGFVTATCGTGCRGGFDTTIRFTPPSRGSGVLEVYEASAKDGSRVNVVRIPVTFTG